MYSIIPLAGPDFHSERYGIKPLFLLEGRPLIQVAIESRHWYQCGELQASGMIFVLRASPHTDETVAFLQRTFQGCRIVLVSHLTRGALLTSLAGLSVIENYDVPIVVDLVDILYESRLEVGQLFSSDAEVGGVLPYFKSSNPKYSYLSCEAGWVVKTAEKEVISDCASAGTYFFRNMSVFLHACLHSVERESEFAVKGILFLCPAFNGVVAQGRRVLPVEVGNVREISLLFH